MGKTKWETKIQIKECGLFSTSVNVGVSKKNREHWFREWIGGKQTFKQLVQKSGYSEQTLKRYFCVYLGNYPVSR